MRLFRDPPELGKEEQTRALAYDLWLKRGSPLETPEDDWFEATSMIQRVESQKVAASIVKLVRTWIRIKVDADKIPPSNVNPQGPD
jgi:hypothetical protein